MSDTKTRGVNTLVRSEARRIPTDENGLVVPPSYPEFEYVEYIRPDPIPEGVMEHHMYWPERNYAGSYLAHHFRRHSYNTVWLQKKEERRLHRVAEVPVPSDDAMHRFFQEAIVLDGLRNTFNAIGDIDDALTSDIVRKSQDTRDRRTRRLSTLADIIEETARLEVIPREIRRAHIGPAVRLLIGECVSGVPREIANEYGLEPFVPERDFLATAI
ncbi:MAG TPA: hypothetical protein VL989_01425 [Candidatus Sulfotelmatobacter sp.]|nr:hypothetical protein [Candidatus Sulfotelmatobacter sp.]